MAKGAVEGGKQRAEEAHKYGAFSPEEGLATAAGLAHGPLSFMQDAYNGLIAAPTHTPPAKFADDFSNAPGVRVLSKNHPGAYGTASTGAGMAVPLGGAAAKGATSLGKTLLHSSAAGAAFSGVGSAGQQYKETGKVDLGQAAEDAEVGAGIGAAIGAAGHVAGKLGSKTSAAPAEKPGDVHQEAGPAPEPKQPTPKPAEPSRATTGHQRKSYDFISKDVKAELSQGDAELHAQAEPLPAESAPQAAETPLSTEGIAQETPQALTTPAAAPVESTTPPILEQKPETPTEPPEKTPEEKLTKGTADEQQAVADELIAKHNETELEKPKAFGYRKVAKGYEITDPEGKVHSRPRESEGKVIERVRKLNAGEIKPTAGARDSYKASERVGAEQQKIVDAAKLPEEGHEQFKALGEAKHALDEVTAKHNAIYDAWVASHPEQAKLAESLKASKLAFKYDNAAEQKVMQENPDQTSLQVQNTRRIDSEFKPAKTKGTTDLANQVKAARAEMTKAEGVYHSARKAAAPFVKDETPVLIPHEKGAVTIRKIPTGEAALKLKEMLQPEAESYRERKIGPVNDWLKNVSSMAAEAYKPNGISQATFPGINQVMSAAKAVHTKYGAHLSPELVHKFLGNELNSDKYNRLADPAFSHHRNNLLGELDSALQGTEKLKTQEEKQAWQDNRYTPDADIQAGAGNASLLNPAQRKGLIAQNRVMNDLADLHEQYYEHLKAQGYDGKGPKSLVPGMNELAGTLRTDLEQLDRGRYGNKSAVDKLGRQITSGIYDMYISGNWGVHQLHAIEAASVGAAYHPIAFAKAVKGLASSKAVRDYVDQFEASSGNMKSIREDSDTVLGKYWRGLQKTLVGGQKNATALAHNKTVQGVAEVLEGSVAERAKLALMRATSAHIAAEEMKYPGGGDALMKHMTDPQTMNPQDRLEAAAKIVYHMNQMVGYSPSGYRDLNVFGRLSTANPIVRWFTPFTTTRIQQSRVLTKFFTNAARAGTSGDFVKMSANVGQGLTMLGTIALIGGRSAVPREIQDGLRTVDPEMAKEVMESLDRFNYIGRALDTEVEHVKPQLMVPMFLGDSFPVQLLKAMDDSVFAKPGSAAQWRGAATLLASLGIASIADRIGSGSILKLHKAFAEGGAEKYTQYASMEGSTALSLAKAGAQLTKTAAHLGLPVKPAEVSDLLGSKQLKTNLPQHLGHSLKTGLNITAAEFVNKVRDDNAFGDSLARMAPELHKKLAEQNRKLSIGAFKAPSDEERAIREGHLEGFWEKAYKRYMEQRKQEHEQVATGRVEA